MSEFFDKFPLVPYNIKGLSLPQYNMPTNILVRVGIISDVLDNVFNYYEYTIREGDRPEILAEKYYGEPEAHWLILLTNRYYDPLYDWPLDYRTFNKYIINRYGSIEDAQTGIHHYLQYQKMIDNATGIITINSRQISLSEYNNLPVSEGSPVTKVLPNGAIVEIYPAYRGTVTNYDYEFAANEKRRHIKLIKKDYYGQVKSEFERLMNIASGQNSVRKPGIRTL